MKKIIITIGMVVLALGMNAQQLTKNEVDDFTGEVKKFTEYYNIAKTSRGSFKAGIERIDNVYWIELYSTTDLGCSGTSGNKVIFKFTDGTSVKLFDRSQIDCRDGATSSFIVEAGSPLFTKDIEKIRFEQSQYYADGETYGPFSLAELLQATK